MPTDAAIHRLLRSEFNYELDGENFLRDLAASKGAIVLTAHMGNYDLGAAIFAEKFQREIRIVRAPEPDPGAAQHVDLALEQSSAGAVKVEYSNAGTALSFDLLAALRKGEIISIQGDRIVGDVARAVAPMFGHDVPLPSGPFVLSFAAETPIYPLFIVRSGFRKYKIIARPPIVAPHGEAGRDAQIESAMQQWSGLLEETIRRHWPQWYAFTPIFTD
jgi:lauroyl/myristoyl acyltransferase